MTTDLVNMLELAMSRKGMNPTGLVKAMGADGFSVSDRTVRRMLDGGNVSMTCLVKACEVLGISFVVGDSEDGQTGAVAIKELDRAKFLDAVKDVPNNGTYFVVFKPDDDDSGT
jgi:hypothetical protein